MVKHDCIESSGNVFAVLGLVDAEERLAKTELAQKIGGFLRKQRLMQEKLRRGSRETGLPDLSR